MSLERLNEIVESRSQQSQAIQAYFRQRYVERGLIYSFASLNDTLVFVQQAGEQISENVKKLLLVSFQAQVIHAFGTADESGMSNFFKTEEVYNVLKEFSFSENSSFQDEEIRIIGRARAVAHDVTRRPLEEPSIPNEAWQVFWKRADRGKEVIVDSIQQSLRTGDPFSFEQFLSVIYDMNTDSFDLEHFSPFKWRKFGLACLGGLLGVANLTAGIPTLGTALSSMAPAVGVIIGAYAAQM
ncbi:MAG TPA: hypothetical protein VGE97_00310 [Nitrososphaera sp.]|jgi:hypothetical protein